MTILIDNRTDWEMPEDIKEAMLAMVEESLEYEGFTKAAEVSISIVDNDEIRNINSRFRGIDRPTDVLSFPLMTFEEGEEPDLNEKKEALLGDIIISVDRAREQAKEYGHSLKREIAFLTVHSMLHLLGYDHIQVEDERVMFKKQKEILEKGGISRE